MDPAGHPPPTHGPPPTLPAVSWRGTPARPPPMSSPAPAVVVVVVMSGGCMRAATQVGTCLGWPSHAPSPTLRQPHLQHACMELALLLGLLQLHRPCAHPHPLAHLQHGAHTGDAQPRQAQRAVRKVVVHLHRGEGGAWWDGVCAVVMELMRTGGCGVSSWAVRSHPRRPAQHRHRTQTPRSRPLADRARPTPLSRLPCHPPTHQPAAPCRQQARAPQQPHGAGHARGGAQVAGQRRPQQLCRQPPLCPAAAAAATGVPPVGWSCGRVGAQAGRTQALCGRQCGEVQGRWQGASGCWGTGAKRCRVWSSCAERWGAMGCSGLKLGVFPTASQLSTRTGGGRWEHGSSRFLLQLGSTHLYQHLFNVRPAAASPCAASCCCC